MAGVHSVNTEEMRGQLSSVSGSELPATVSGDLEGRLADSDETSPLLPTNRRDAARVVLWWDHSEPWLSVRSSVSAFFGKNAGLLLVTASQFFFSAMNISVKWLNSLDKPVPTLEVCLSSRAVVICELTSVFAGDMG